MFPEENVSLPGIKLLIMINIDFSYTLLLGSFLTLEMALRGKGKKNTIL